MKDLFIYIIVIVIACIAPIYTYFIYRDKDCNTKINNLSTQIKNVEEDINKQIATLNNLTQQVDKINEYDEKILSQKTIRVRGGLNHVYIANGIKAVKGRINSSDILSLPESEEIEVLRLYSSKYELEDFSISIRRYVLEISFIGPPTFLPVFDIYINFDKKKFIFAEGLNTNNNYDYIIGFIAKKINIKIGDKKNIYQPQNILHLHDILDSKFKQDINIINSNCLESFDFLLYKDC